MPLSAGERLGPYEILASIGAGGMGEVYRATDTRLARTVAIKVSKKEFSERFEREARAISALNHPHICQLYDVGPNYLVMEHVDGAPLKGPLPLDKVLEYATQIASALDAAHSNGITHRDLKPANILVTKPAGVKLLDFGLAKIGKAVSVSAEDATVTIDQALTGKGTILGTLVYMSPEQIHGQEADARSDIFSFGLVLYEMITGKRAFEGASPASVMAAILERPAPSIADVAPGALNRVLKRCLEKDPEDRWQSARDLRAGLELVTEEPAVVPAKAPRSTRLYAASAVAGVAVVVATAVSAIHFREQPPPVEVTRFQIEPPEGQTFNGAFSLSPDGKYLGYSAADSAGVVRLFARPLSSLDAKAVADPPFGGVNWSPDGRYLEILDGKNPRRVNVADGSSEPLAAGAAARESTNSYPHVLPDGEHVVAFERSNIVLRSRSAPNKVLKSNVQQTNFDFAPIPGAGGDGYLLFMQDSALMAQRLDVQQGELTGDLVTVVNGVARGGGGTGFFSVSDNGILAFRPGTRDRVTTLLDRQGKELATFPGSASLALSPDGNRAVVQTQQGGAASQAQLLLVDLMRQTSEQFTFGMDDARNPVWSPDGTRVAFAIESKRAIYVKPANGAQAEELLYQVDAPVHPNSWSRDGKFLLFTRDDPKTHSDLWVLNLADRKATPFLQTEFVETKAQISPDGRWVAYVSTETGLRGVYVRSFPDGAGKWFVSRGYGDEPRWRPDGRELFYRTTQQMSSVEVLAGASFQFGQPKLLFKRSGATGGEIGNPYYDVFPDGQRILMTSFAPETTTGPITVVLNWMETLKK